MSRLTGSRDIATSSIYLPGGWEERLDRRHVAELASDLRRGLFPGPIRVTRVNGRIEMVQGFHRLAAHIEAGVKRIRADFARYGTIEEREEDQICENLKRLPLVGIERDRAIARLVELRARIRGGHAPASESPGPDPGQVSPKRAPEPGPDPVQVLPKRAPDETGKPGRPKSAAGIARDEVAAAIHVTTEALKKAEQRARKAAAPVPQNTAPTPPPPPIRTFGLPLTDALVATVTGAQACIDKADRLLRQAQGALTGLLEVAGYSSTVAQDLHTRLHEVAYLLRSSRPEALCPWCKGLPVACMACHSQRFVVAGRMHDIPAELLLEGLEAVVGINGRYQTLVEYHRAQANGAAHAR